MDTAEHGDAGTLSVSFLSGGERIEIAIPPPGDQNVRSCFAIGLPKAGSTLLNGIVQRVARVCHLSFVNIPGQLRQAGLKPGDTPAAVNELFHLRGYLYGGFRAIAPSLHIPDWARGRTVVLVRDPRDMIVSLYFSQAYSHRPPGSGAGGAAQREFEHKREKARSTAIDEFALGGAGSFVDIFEQLEGKTSRLQPEVYRYEDVIFEKKAWIRRMLDHLELTVPDPQIDRIVASVDQRPPVEDASSHVRKVVPGDHREKLSPETIERLNEAFAPILDRYGYR